MNRFTEILAQGSARLAFWRKSAEVPPEQLEPEDPGSIRKAETDSSETADVAAREVGRFARLKQVLHRWRKPDHEQLPDPGQAVVTERASPEQRDGSVTADDVPAHKLSFAARLKNKLRRQPKPEQIEEDAESLKSAEEKNKAATASADADSTGNEDAMHVSRNRQVLAMLSNKWLWISSAGVMLLAIIVVMLVMLLHSEKEIEQLEVDLLATQKKLDQPAIAKQTIANQAAGIKASSGSASDSSPETVGDAADPNLDINAEDCLVSSKESVTQNLKNCIESFNRSVSN